MPAPPPAPPPFIPQSIEVALGARGGTLTLLTKQDGGFTLNGEDFLGGTVEGANGLVYELEQTEGSWLAKHVPQLVAVALGTSGSSVTLAQQEDGSYSFADSAGVPVVAVSPDGTPQGAEAANGNRYRLVSSDSGWRAVFDPPRPSSAGLGTSGESVLITRTEDGRHWIGDMEVADGSVVAATNGNRYSLSTAGGVWTASYVPPAQAVTLGQTGETVVVTRAEDGGYWLGGEPLHPGGTAEASNGNRYELSADSGGTWSARYAPAPPATVALGSSGAGVAVTRNEDGTYTVTSLTSVSAAMFGTEGVLVTATATNGNLYAVSVVDGRLQSTFLPAEPQARAAREQRRDGCRRDSGGSQPLDRRPCAG